MAKWASKVWLNVKKIKPTQNCWNNGVSLFNGSKCSHFCLYCNMLDEKKMMFNNSVSHRKPFILMQCWVRWSNGKLEIFFQVNMILVKSVSSFSRGAQGSPKFYRSCPLLLLNLKKKQNKTKLQVYLSVLSQHTQPNMFALIRHCLIPFSNIALRWKLWWTRLTRVSLIN